MPRQLAQCIDVKPVLGSMLILKSYCLLTYPVNIILIQKGIVCSMYINSYMNIKT